MFMGLYFTALKFQFAAFCIFVSQLIGSVQIELDASTHKVFIPIWYLQGEFKSSLTMVLVFLIKRQKSTGSLLLELISRRDCEECDCF